LSHKPKRSPHSFNVTSKQNNTTEYEQNKQHNNLQKQVSTFSLTQLKDYTKSFLCAIPIFVPRMLHILQPIYLQDNESYKYKLPLTPCTAGAPIIPCSGQLLPHIRTAATALVCSPTSQLPTASTHAASVTVLHALDRPLSKLLSAPAADFVDVAEHQPCPAESLTHTVAESAKTHARCHCRCMLPFLPVAFTSSLGLPIVQIHRQPLLPILSTLLNSSTLPISPVLPNFPLSHCVIPALFRQALDNPRPSPNSRQHTATLTVVCCRTHTLPIFATVTRATTP